jgi:hypothetical protein
MLKLPRRAESISASYLNPSENCLANGQPLQYACSKIDSERIGAMTIEFRVPQHFEGKDPIVRSIYDRILAESRKFGPVLEEPKKTSIHLVNRTAFAGVLTRKSALILTIKSAAPIKHSRIMKSEKVSASRFHQEVKLASPKEVDPQLIGWLKEAYTLSS